MVINTNLSAMYANRTLGVTQSDMSKTLEKLSSGQRINRAGDDASGLSVSEKMRAQIRGLNQAQKNTSNAVSFIQTTEGFLQGTQDVLHRLRELAVQSSNGLYTAEDRLMIQVEVSQLVREIDRVASHGQYNGMNLLTGRFGRDTQGISIQLGANMDQNETVFVGAMTAEALGVRGAQGADTILSLSTSESANASIGTLDAALKMVSKQRADLGAYQVRFEGASKSISIAAENLQAAESGIRDTDMAQEMVSLAKYKILQQVGMSMVSQANAKTQSVLGLLNN